MLTNVYRGKKIFITGNTGFKGTWLTLWLLQMGAKVHGYSLEAATSPSLFEELQLSKDIEQTYGDVRDFDKLSGTLKAFKPDFVFHLAAEAIVRECYQNPRRAFETNMMGPVNVLDACRELPGIVSIVIVTSDKCYENVEWKYGYRETDQLGGKDPYSASKACAEIASSSMVRSYFLDGKGTKVSTARAGNVIGGGDWASNRIVPDCVRSWSKNEQVVIRSPHATRPWQHVLEPLSGYLLLGAAHARGDAIHGESYNFGPHSTTEKTVLQLLQEIQKSWKNARYDVQEDQNDTRKEAGLLKLNCEKADFDLKWRPCLSFEETIDFTSTWYQAFYTDKAKSIKDFTLNQITAYEERGRAQGIVWAK